MINSIDTYVVGLSVLSFFVLKTYLAAREVWKQLGSAGLLPAWLVTLNFIQHDSRTVHTI